LQIANLEFHLLNLQFSIFICISSVARESSCGFFVFLQFFSYRFITKEFCCGFIHALEATGFVIEDAQTESMWVPVEIVLGRKTILLPFPRSGV